MEEKLKIFKIIILLLVFLLAAGLAYFFINKYSSEKIQDQTACHCDCPVKEEQNREANNVEQTGVFYDLYPEYIVEKNGNYYVKFYKQMEDEKFPDYCYGEDNEFIENSDKGCFLQGRPLQNKEKADIDLSKEYKVNLVSTITYDAGQLTYHLMPSYLFYRCINHNWKPTVQYYGDWIDNLSECGFDVFMINDEIIEMTEVYFE